MAVNAAARAFLSLVGPGFGPPRVTHTALRVCLFLFASNDDLSKSSPPLELGKLALRTEVLARNAKPVRAQNHCLKCWGE